MILSGKWLTKSRLLRLFFFISLCLLAQAGPVRAAALALLAQETPLTTSVTPAELNLDSQGVLWVSDADAGQIRSVNTASGAYTIYPVGGAPSDARSDGAGTVWWADFNSNQLSRLTTANNMTTTWAIPGSLGLWGTALDQSGQVWASDGSDPYLYKLNPANNQFCQYTLPNSGVGEYLLADQTRIWIGDSVNARIVRLDGATFTWWYLPSGSQPRDLAMDGDGRVWWTDPSKGYVARLDPAANKTTTFTPPASGTPQMLTLAGGKVWYSQQSPSRVVELDPASASGITVTVTTSSAPASPTCSTLLAQAPVAVTPSSGHASWNVTNYAALINQAGWLIYGMPVNAAPYGIAAAPTATRPIWLVDQGRQVLAKLSPSSSIYLPLIIKR